MLLHQLSRPEAVHQRAAMQTLAELATVWDQRAAAARRDYETYFDDCDLIGVEFDPKNPMPAPLVMHEAHLKNLQAAAAAAAQQHVPMQEGAADNV